MVSLLLPADFGLVLDYLYSSYFLDRHELEKIFHLIPGFFFQLRLKTG